MSKKVLIIFITIILSLTIFNASICLAVLDTPTNLGIADKSPISVLLTWNWEENGEGTIAHFRIKYRRVQDPALDWTEPADLPQENSREYQLGGLLPYKDYQWMIMAEATNPADSSPYSNIGLFETEMITQEEPENGNGGFLQDIPLENPLGKDTLWEAIDAVLNFFIIAAFAIAPILIIYSAFLMIFATGDATKISRGKEIIFWTVIALAVILFAKGLPSVIKGAFSG